MLKLLDKLANDSYLTAKELLFLLDYIDNDSKEYLFAKALETKKKHYGNKIYLRSIIEFTNYCKNNCLYCGIRKSNKNAERYRLSINEILEACNKSYELGYRTFVLQGGEDSYYTDEKLEVLIKKIKNKFPLAAITLSIGENSYSSYKRYYDAGADRYLLRHETASAQLYTKFHPKQSLENRKRCLLDLKEIGYQVGAGFLIGLPGQTNEHYVKDLLFLKKLEPHMIGIGPFIAHKDTPLAKEKNGTMEKTLILLAIIRLLLPEVLLPATTALGTINPIGREKGLMVGANVLMPNITPINVRHKYSLYNNKACTGNEDAENLKNIKRMINILDFSLDMSRGDNILWRRM